ncbi:unnamed protein product, partial [Vitis vinifera]|uniref:Uncharacterized protein n=1 Tax=Vitis vinifera TaxID=29760 RepID=D7SXX0_VITVI
MHHIIYYNSELTWLFSMKSSNFRTEYLILVVGGEQIPLQTHFGECYSSPGTSQSQTRNITPVPLVPLARLHPVRWCIPCLKSHKIYNACNQSSRDLEIKSCNTNL